jgi:hypothetical protein
MPPGPWRVKVRSDSAAYQQEVLDHWDSHGWEFAVSADMTQRLKREIEELRDEAWHLWRMEKDGIIKEYAEVPIYLAEPAKRRALNPIATLR